MTLRPRPAGPPSASTATLAVIRIALVSGVLLFGGVVWYLRSRQPPAATVDPDALRLAGQVVWSVAILGILIAFLLHRSATRERRTTLAVVAWALGESTALYGGVFWLLVGESRWYGYGLVCLVLTYLIFPVRGTR